MTSGLFPAGLDDRRFFVLDVSDANKEDHAFFEAIQRQMGSGGREALLHLLQTHDLSGFNVRSVPKTQALREQQAESLRGAEMAWFECLASGDLPGAELCAD